MFIFPVNLIIGNSICSILLLRLFRMMFLTGIKFSKVFPENHFFRNVYLPLSFFSICSEIIFRFHIALFIEELWKIRSSWCSHYHFQLWTIDTLEGGPARRKTRLNRVTHGLWLAQDQEILLDVSDILVYVTENILIIRLRFLSILNLLNWFLAFNVWILAGFLFTSHWISGLYSGRFAISLVFHWSFGDLIGSLSIKLVSIVKQ